MKKHERKFRSFVDRPDASLFSLSRETVQVNIKKTAYQAQTELKCLLDEIRKTAQEGVSLDFLRQKTRRLATLLSGRLPTTLSSESLCGFFACHMVTSLLKASKNTSPDIERYLKTVLEMTEVAERCFPLKGVKINLEFWLKKLLSPEPSISDQALLAVFEDDVGPTLEKAVSLMSEQLDEKAHTFLMRCDELGSLFKAYEGVKYVKQEENGLSIAKHLSDIADFWKTEGEYVLTVDKGEWGTPFTYAMMFYNAALIVLNNPIWKISDTESVPLQKEWIEKNKSVEKLLLSVTKSRQTDTTEKQDQENREALAFLRKQLNDDLNPVLEVKITTDKERLERADQLKEVTRKLVENIKQFIGKLVSQSEACLGPAPCAYSFIGFGSLEKQSCTPYSDVEFGILLETGKDTEENRQYFRNLSYLFQAKVINLRETPIPFDLFGHSFDGLTGMGFCLDLGGKISLGRRHDHKDKEHGEQYGQLKYELIGESHELLKYLEDAAFKIDRLLPVEVGRCVHIFGNDAFTKEYQNLVHERLSIKDESEHTFYQRRAIELLTGNQCLEGDLDKYSPELRSSEAGKLFDVKKEVYRIPDRLIDNLAFFYGIQAESMPEKINALVEDKFIHKENREHLHIIQGIATELRFRTYQYYGRQKEQLGVFAPSSVLHSEGASTFYREDNRILLERFYYTALPFCKGMQMFCEQWEQTPQVLCEHVFFDDGLQVKADICRRFYDYKNARMYLKSILEKCPENAQVLSDLGSVHHVLGDAARALDYLEQALAILKKVYGDEHPTVATSLNNVGGAWDALGDAKRALGYHEQALAILKKVYGDEHPTVATSLSNVGAAWDDLGDAKRALSYHEQALSIRKKVYGDEHPDVAGSLNNVGTAWDALGNVKRALGYHEQALVIRKKVYGDEHPDVAASLNNVGGAWKALGDAKRALSYHEQALAILKKVYGDEHPTVATSLNNVGAAWDALGNVKRALGYHEQALAILKKVYGDEHPTVATSLSNVGAAWDDLGDAKRALGYHEQALVIRKKVYGDEHPTVATSLSHVGGAWDALGDAKRALSYHEQALAIRKKVYGDEHPHVATSLNNVGKLCQELKNTKKANACSDALRIIQKKGSVPPELWVQIIGNQLSLEKPKSRISKEEMKEFQEALKAKKISQDVQLTWYKILNGSVPLPAGKEYKQLVKELPKKCKMIVNKAFNLTRYEPESSPARSMSLETKAIKASNLSSNDLMPLSTSLSFSTDAKKIFHSMTSNATSFTKILYEDIANASTVEALIEIALQLDKDLYSHLPSPWHNPGVAGLCAWRLISDGLHAIETHEQFSGEIKTFLEAIDDISAKALDSLDQEGDKAFIKPLINSLYEYSGGFERKVYSEQRFSLLQEALSGLPAQGQLVYRPTDGRFFVLIDDLYISRTRIAEKGGEPIGNLPSAQLGQAHITVNEGMRMTESQHWLSEALKQWGETDTPLYTSKQAELVYFNKAIDYEIVGAYEGRPKTNSRLAATHQLTVNSQALKALAAQGLEPKPEDYEYHITFAEQPRLGHPCLAHIQDIAEQLQGSDLSRRLKKILSLNISEENLIEDASKVLSKEKKKCIV